MQNLTKYTQKEKKRNVHVYNIVCSICIVCNCSLLCLRTEFQLVNNQQLYHCVYIASKSMHTKITILSVYDILISHLWEVSIVHLLYHPVWRVVFISHSHLVPASQDTVQNESNQTQKCGDWDTNDGTWWHCTLQFDNIEDKLTKWHWYCYDKTHVAS